MKHEPIKAWLTSYVSIFPLFPPRSFESDIICLFPFWADFSLVLSPYDQIEADVLVSQSVIPRHQLS